MAYTEIKERNGKKYYYRVISVRKGRKVNKKRKYLGVNLTKNNKTNKEKIADKEFESELKKNERSEIEKIKSKIMSTLRRNKIKKAGIFGSYAAHKQKKDSDVGILIKPAKGMSLLDLSGMKIELEKRLGKKVDLVSYNYIHPYLKEKIMKTEVRII